MERPAAADYPPGARLPTRVIDDFELVWMLRGRASFLAADEITLTPGQLLVIPPGVRHGFSWDPTRPSRHGYVHFESADVDGELPTRVRLRRMTDEDPLAGLCAYLLWLGSGAQDGWLDPARETLRFIVRLVVSGPLPDTQPSPPLAWQLRAMIGVLRLEWSHLPLQRIGVEELASAVSVSRGYLNRLFRGGFDISAATALERLRFARAEALLTGTDLTVETIARHCGFADLSHFSHRFTSIYRMPPTGYRSEGSRTPSVLEHSGLRRLHHLLWE